MSADTNPIRDAIAQGPVNALKRRAAGLRFTVEQSVDDLLDALLRAHAPTPDEVLTELEAIALLDPEPPSMPANAIELSA